VILGLFSILSPAEGGNIVTTWDGSVGDWFDAARWSAGIPSNDPLNAFQAIVNTGSVTLSSSVTTSGFSLGAPALLTIQSGNTYLVAPSFTGSSLISGMVSLQSASFLDVTDTMSLTNATIGGEGTFRQLASTLVLAGSNVVKNLVLDGGAIVQGTGTVTVTGHADFLNLFAFSATGKLVIPSSASLNFNSSSTSVNLIGKYQLAGVTTVNGFTNYSGSANVTNSGTITIGVIGAPVFAPQTFTSTGIINVNAGTLGLTNVFQLGGRLLVSDLGKVLLSGAGTLTNGTVLTSVGGPIIDSNVLTILGNASVDHFTMFGVAGSGTLTLLGNNSWSGGFINGPTVVNPFASTLVTTSSTGIGPGTLTNAGVLAIGYWPASGESFSGGLNASGNGRVLNTGTMIVESGVGNSGGSITNSGLIINGNTASTAVRSLSVPISNSGTISGIFQLSTLFNSGVVSGTNTISGTLTNSGTISGTNTLNGLLTNSGLFTGTGSVTGSAYNMGTISGQITLSTGSSSGVISADGPISNATLTITGAYTLTNGAGITSTQGTVNAQGALTIFGQVKADHLTFNGLTNSGTLNLSGPDAWVGGAITNANSQSTLHFLTDAAVSLGTAFSYTLINGRLINEGTVSAPLTGFTSFSLNNSVLQNAGTFALPPGGITSGSIFNTGQLTSTGSKFISSTLYNAGTLTNNGGSLTLTSQLGGSSSGMFVASPVGSTISFATNPTYLLSNATLSGAGLFSGSIVIGGTVAVSNAAFSSVSGTGSLDVSGSLLLSSNLVFRNIQLRVLPTGSIPQSFSNTWQLDDATLLYQASAGTLTGTTTFKHSSAMINQGTLTIGQVNVMFLSSDNATTQYFANSGLLRTASFGSGTISVPFYNTGTVTTSSSSLTFSGGGTGSGVFNNAAVQFSSPYTLDGAKIITTATASASLTGSIVLNHVNAADNYFLTPGTTLSGSGTLTVSNVLTLAGSQAGSNGTTGISNGAHVVVLPGGTLSLAPNPSITTYVDNATLESQGKVTIGVFAPFILLNLAHGAVFVNSGTFSLSTFTSIFEFAADSSTANAFINRGIMTFDGFLNPSVIIAAPFYNSGTLTSAQGSGGITLTGGGSASGLINTFVTIKCPYTLNNATIGASVSTNDILTIRGVVRSNGLWVGAGTDGDGSITGPGVGWSGGTATNSGGMTVNGTGSSLVVYYGAGDRNSSRVPVDLALRSDGVAAKMLAGATITLGSGRSAGWGALYSNFSGADTIGFKNAAQIVNNGAFYSYITSVAFTNSDNHSANAFINSGIFGRSSLTQAAGSNVTTMGIPFHNSGVVDIQQGKIDFAGGYFDESPLTDNTADFQFAAGTGLYFSGGSYDFGDSAFDLGAGGLFGTGVVHGYFVSSGTISPGNSPGTLVVNGDLALADSAMTVLDVVFPDGGVPVADLLTVHGNFTAGGMLALHILSGVPDGTPLKMIVADNFSGAFLNVGDGERLADADGMGTYLVSYTPGGIVLSDFVATPVPEPWAIAWVAPGLVGMLLRRRRRVSIRFKSRG
jgi:hypothetical protein